MLNSIKFTLRKKHFKNSLTQNNLNEKIFIYFKDFYTMWIFHKRVKLLQKRPERLSEYRISIQTKGSSLSAVI